MGGFAGLTTYGISCAVIAGGIASGIIPEELHLAITLIWAVAGLALAFVGVLKGKK
jgi:hypothetical protein